MYIRYIPTQKRKPVGDPNQVAFLGRRDFREFLEEVRSVPNHEHDWHDWDKICFWAGLLQAKLRRRVAVIFEARKGDSEQKETSHGSAGRRGGPCYDTEERCHKDQDDGNFTSLGFDFPSQ